jgi:hypothetical protein
MRDYRAFIIGEDGHVTDRINLWCRNDADAKEWAKGLVDKHDVELWHRKEKIAVFKHETH